ncbi:unnamed protein product [Clavelina lepadiformis]|uniref:Protein-PII uridylyltransferase N-terminal domain-containing protein n=1 Tax=Clavelina lepadiformis TaxID=159417 RepID=A0ABP0FTB0_CLALP
MARDPDKIKLIQSAALLNAALARERENKPAVEEDLKRLCDKVVKNAKRAYANIPDDQKVDVKPDAPVSVLDVSKKVLERLEIFRSYFELKFKDMKIIPSQVESKELSKLKQQKVSTIKHIQERISADYTEYMEDILQRCIEIIGGRPKCGYALMGMGSLARHEITPYSDFESAILLEDGVQRTSGYESIKEYFRWMTVLFQIIIINLGETKLYKVAIPSLNDYYQNYEGENWFRDDYTKNGVSLDGWQPFACTSPLGRQQGTRRKQFKTELIQPVSKMLDNLKMPRSSKIGYNLSNTLAETCFVTGDKLVYDEYVERVQEILDVLRYDKTYLSNLTRIVMKDRKTFRFKNLLKAIENGKFNHKKMIYRSITIFVSALGRFHAIQKRPCFDIIKKLADFGVLSCKDAGELCYAVAIACEVRSKIYLHEKGQEDNIKYSFSRTKKNTSLIVKTVGEKCIFDYFTIADSLQNALFDFDVKFLQKRLVLPRYPSLFNVLVIIWCFGLHEHFKHISREELERIRDYKEIQEEDDDESSDEDRIHEGYTSSEDSSENYELNQQENNNITYYNDGPDVNEECLLLSMLGLSLCYTEKSDTAFDTFLKAVRKQITEPENSENYQKDYINKLNACMSETLSDSIEKMNYFMQNDSGFNASQMVSHEDGTENNVYAWQTNFHSFQDLLYKEMSKARTELLPQVNESNKDANIESNGNNQSTSQAYQELKRSHDEAFTANSDNGNKRK